MLSFPLRSGARTLPLVLAAGTALLLLAGCGGGGGGPTTDTTGQPDPTYSIFGVVQGVITDGVVITLTGAGTGTFTTSGSTFSFSGLSSGTYTLTPSKPGYAFSPPSVTLEVHANASGVSFAANAVSGYTIAGRISPENPASNIAGVVVTLSGDATQTVTTASDGTFSFSGLPSGTYTLTPSRPGLLMFSPAYRTVTVTDASIDGQNFTAVDVPVAGPTVSGTVWGDVTGGVQISLSGVTTTTSGDSFSFSEVQDGTYTLTASRSGYFFDPPSQEVTVSGASVSGLSFRSAQEHCAQYQGAAGVYSYSAWTASGTGCIAPFDDAAFGARWADPKDFLALMGRKMSPTKTFDEFTTFTADFSEQKTGTATNYSFIGIHGWTNSPIVEFYIVEDWFGASPTTEGTKVGSYAITGEGTYDVYKSSLTESTPFGPAKVPFTRLKAFRQSARQSGHVSIATHFARWTMIPVSLGAVAEAMLLAEVDGGTGTVAFTWGSVTAQ